MNTPCTRSSTMSMEDIAEWIRSEYSPNGVEVGSLGTRSLTLNVPAELGLTETCAALWNRYGATCELRQSANGNDVTIIVWLAKHNTETASTFQSGGERHPDYANSPSTKLQTIAGSITFTVLMIVVVSALQAAFIKFERPVTTNATAADWIKAGVDAFYAAL